MAPNSASAMESGPHGLLRVERGDRRDAEELRTARVEESDISLLEGVDVGVAAPQDEPLPFVLHVRQRLARIRGGEEHQRRAVGVVLHDLFREQADADDGRGHAELRCGRVLEEVLTDVVRVPRPERELLADPVPVPLRRGLVHRDLVDALRIRQPTLRGREAVLVEETAVEARERLEVLAERGLPVHDVRDQRRDVDARPRHFGERRDRLDGLGVVRAGVDGHGGRVRVAQKPRICRLRAARAREREETQPAGDPEQDHDAEIAPPPVAERGPEPVPGEGHEPIRAHRAGP